MASINVFIKGHEELEKKYYQRSTRLKQTTPQALSEIGKLLKTHVTKFIKKKTGNKTETRYSPTRTVRVSSPGAYPNHDRGRLVKGIRSFVKRKPGGKYNLNFQSKAPYALDLEFGTRNMAARPYMRPTLKANRKRINAIITKGVRRAL